MIGYLIAGMLAGMTLLLLCIGVTAPTAGNRSDAFTLAKLFGLFSVAAALITTAVRL